MSGRRAPRARRRSRRCCARSCASSCGRSSRCPAMSLFSVTTYVLFHFAPAGQPGLAATWPAACCGSRCCSPRCSASTACSSPTPSRAASTASCSRPSTAARCCSRRRVALALYLVALEIVAVPAFGLLLLEPSLGPALPGPARRRSRSADLGVARDRNARRRARRAHARARPARPAARRCRCSCRCVLAAAARDDAAARARRARRDRRCAGWLIGLYDLVSGDRLRGLRLPPGGLGQTLYGHQRPAAGWRSRPPSRDRALTLLRSSSSGRPTTPTQGFLQKIFYVHVPLAIVTLCGFVPAGSWRSMHLRTRDPRWDMRSYVAIHISPDLRRRRADHRLDLGEGRVGSLVGLERADAGLVPDHDAALRDLPAAALRDRGPRAPGARRVGVRDHVPASSCRSTSRSCASRPPTCTRARSTTSAATCPGGCRSRSWLRWLSVALLCVTLWRYEMAAKHARAQLRALRRLLGGTRTTAPLRRSAAPTLTTPAERADAARLPLHTAGPYVAAAYIVFVRADPALRRDHGRQARAGSSASSGELEPTRRRPDAGGARMSGGARRRSEPA